MENKKNPPPDTSINKEPNTPPSTGQHQPDIQDEKFKKKRINKPQKRNDLNPEEFPNGNPEEYNDGDPVEEKSSRISSSL
jgi:hypothetical protein